MPHERHYSSHNIKKNSEDELVCAHSPGNFCHKPLESQLKYVLEPLMLKENQ